MTITAPDPAIDPTVVPTAVPQTKGPLRRALDRFFENRAARAGLLIVVPILLAVSTYSLWWPFSPNAIDLRAINKGPSAIHWLGSDGVGRDVMARLLQGGRISLLVAVCSVAISIVIGFLVGAVASFGGRLVDGTVMRFVDLAMTLPPVIFLLVLASIAGTGIAPTILVISLLSWPVLSRM
ncbi:MAG: ABC transporter permease, partial [Mesorhizobium sp.]